MKKIIFHSISFFILVSVGFSGFTQDIMDTVVHLNEVMIFSQKPLKDRALVASEIDSINIRESNVSGLAELLSSNSNIYIRSYGYGALSTASFRGTSASHTRVFWNDMEINDPASGQVDFSLIPVSFVEEIKLYHGGSSVRHSAGGLGGVILLNSLPAWKQDTRVSIGQELGSFNTWTTNLSVSSGKKNWYYKINGYHESSANDFTYTNTSNGLRNIERYENADFKKTGLQGDIYLKRNNKGIFSMHTWLQRSDRNFAPVMSYLGPGRTENQADKVIRWVSRYKYYGEILNSEISTGFARNELNYYLKEDSESNYIFDTHSDSWNIFSRYEGDLSLGASTRLRTESNFSLKNSKFEDDKMRSGYSAKRVEAGSSLSLHHEFSFPVTTYALVRMDLYGDKISPLSPAAGIEFSPENLYGFTFKSNLSRNYHFPDLNDLYWIPGGNPSLLPENGYMTDAAIDYQFNNSRLNFTSSLTFFHSVIDNWILWKPGEFGFWRAENLEKVRSRGIEHRFSIKFKDENLSARLSATYSLTRTNRVDGNSDGIFSEAPQLIYTPVHKANLNMAFNPGKFKFSYQYLFTGRRYTTTDNDPDLALDPFHLQNLKIARTMELEDFSFELGFGIFNIFDTDYQVIRSRPMPGRHYNLMLKATF
jgi:iron complex outermembrane receptor protein